MRASISAMKLADLLRATSLLSLACILLASSAWGQDAATSASEAKAKVESIPIEQIGVASQRAQRVFKEMAEDVAPSKLVEEVSEEAFPS